MRKPERSAELASDSSPADLLDDGQSVNWAKDGKANEPLRSNFLIADRPNTILVSFDIAVFVTKLAISQRTRFERLET